MKSQGIGVIAGPDLPRTPTQLFIAGTWREAADGATFDIISPTSGIGRELGWAGIEGNTEEKTVTITL
jgi:acyl-CoA reductase-like NAD-dependent aldehyde dehydrogenase